MFFATQLEKAESKRPGSWDDITLCSPDIEKTAYCLLNIYSSLLTIKPPYCWDGGAENTLHYYLQTLFEAYKEWLREMTFFGERIPESC